MWAAIAKLAELGLRVIERVWPDPKDEPTADPRDIATAQRSAEAADREGKLASKRSKKKP
jgi:hypothetical protein